jgi:putative membrane protein
MHNGSSLGDSVRTLLRFLFSATGLLVASSLVPGIHHGPFMELLGVAVILGALNATLGALLKYMTLVPMVCSFGCLSLFINGLVFWLVGMLASRLHLGFAVDGYWAAFFGALVSSVVATLLEWILIGRENRPRPPEEPRQVKIIN